MEGHSSYEGSRAEHRRLSRWEPLGISARRGGRASIVWAEGRGAAIRDVDGNEFIDLTSSFGAAAVGYSHPRVVNAVQSQAGRLSHCMVEIFPHDMYAPLLSRIAEAAGRTEKPQVALTSSGSEAVEFAVKLAMRATEKRGTLAFSGGFHGQSIGALACAGHRDLREPFAPLLSDSVVHVPYPDPIHPPVGTGSSVGDICLQIVENILRSESSGTIPIGGVLVEPMQNLSGYIVPPPSFLSGLEELCRDHGALLIMDEVFTGFGRCGNWLAADSQGVKPDVVCVGKAMSGGYPIAACVADREVMEVLDTDLMIPLHGSTFMGNPVCCAAAIAAIETIQNEDLVERSGVVGKTILDSALVMQEECAEIIDVRGLGSAIAIEFNEDGGRDLVGKVLDDLMALGIIALSSRFPKANVLTISPAFVIEDAQIDTALEALREAIFKNTTRRHG
ncbi:MAG: aspartate aminotransferase family protein [Thermoleophilia bacterium]